MRRLLLLIVVAAFFPSSLAGDTISTAPVPSAEPRLRLIASNSSRAQFTVIDAPVHVLGAPERIATHGIRRPLNCCYSVTPARRLP